MVIHKNCLVIDLIISEVIIMISIENGILGVVFSFAGRLIRYGIRNAFDGTCKNKLYTFFVFA